MSIPFMTCRSAFAIVSAASLGLVVVGCGFSKPTGTVSGKVTHKNKPVVWGTVTLIASDNKSYAGSITLEGTYSIPNVPAGPVKLCVTSPDPDAGKRSTTPAVASGSDGDAGGPGDGAGGTRAEFVLPKGAWFPIHEKYSDPEKSGLTGTVDRDTTIDLNLK